MKQNTKTELSKLPGFDILERLPEEQMLRSYNEDFYTTLNSVKIMSQPFSSDNRLLYHFEQNDNASVSTTTGQLLTTYEEIVKSNIETKKHIFNLREEIVCLKEELDLVDKSITAEYMPEIVNMKKRFQNFLVEQKTENYKLIKEIAILEKEKLEIQQNVYICLGKLHKLEREVGVKSKAYTYLFDQGIIENEINNKFLIEREDI